MDGLTIFWTHTAVMQRDYIFDYWNNRNKSATYSKKLNLTIRRRIELLKSQPEMGKKTNFGETRTISLGHYSILYKIDEPKIIITGFWDNRQDPKKLLKFLKKSL
jgi:toxin YoeB